MSARTLVVLALFATLACAGAPADTNPDPERVRPIEPIDAQTPSDETTETTEMEETDKIARAPSGLEGVEWILVAMGSDGALVDEASITLKLEGENLSGRSGCNLYQSRMVVDGSAVTVGRIASTKRACPPPVMEIESRFLAALAGVEAWELAGDRLILGYRTADGTSGDLAFERSAPT